MTRSQSIFIDIGEGLSMMIGLPAISTWKTQSRPKKAKRGTLGFNLQTNRLELYDGSNWYEAPLKQK